MSVRLFALITRLQGRIMYLGKTILALSIAAALTACGGGGGDAAPAAQSINLAPLVGTDNSVYGTFTNSCTGSGTDIAIWEAVATGDTLRMYVKDKYGSSALDFTLKYITGDNNTGFVFNGSVRDVATGAVATVESTLLKNNSSNGGYNITGTINSTDRGCIGKVQLI